MTTKLIYIIGHPLGHTLSPAMHNAAFTALGLDYKYESRLVKPQELARAMEKLRAENVAGFNVTIPHKEAIIPLLDDIAKPAQLIGAVNTVVNEAGKLVGYNTDGAGFIESLKKDARLDPRGKQSVVLGAGGASRAVCVTLAKAGAQEIILTDLLEQKVQALAEYLNDVFECNCFAVAMNGLELQTALNSAALLVNTTPIGMHPRIKECPLTDNIKLKPPLLVYDLVYNPATTALMHKARAAGCRSFSGLGMLVRQGASAFTLWTGEEAPVEIMRKAAVEELNLP